MAIENDNKRAYQFEINKLTQKYVGLSSIMEKQQEEIENLRRAVDRLIRNRTETKSATTKGTGE